MKYIIMCIALLMVAGCEAGRRGVLDIATEDIENIRTLRKIAKDYLSVTEFQVATIKKGLGNRINELPKDAFDALEELAALSLLDPNSMTDTQLGDSFGLRLYLLRIVIGTALETVAPDVLKYLLL